MIAMPNPGQPLTPAEALKNLFMANADAGNNAANDHLVASVLRAGRQRRANVDQPACPTCNSSAGTAELHRTPTFRSWQCSCGTIWTVNPQLKQLSDLMHEVRHLRSQWERVIRLAAKAPQLPDAELRRQLNLLYLQEIDPGRSTGPAEAEQSGADAAAEQTPPNAPGDRPAPPEGTA